MSDELKPGRDLDALIAERVMGRKNELDWCDMCECHPYGCTCQSGTYGPRPYSTHIAAAWAVVERICYADPNSGYNPEFELKCVESSCDEMHWYASFYDRYGKAKWRIPQSLGFGMTAPHAICLAALKAIEG